MGSLTTHRAHTHIISTLVGIFFVQKLQWFSCYLSPKMNKTILVIGCSAEVHVQNYLNITRGGVWASTGYKPELVWDEQHCTPHNSSSKRKAVLLHANNPIKRQDKSLCLLKYEMSEHQGEFLTFLSSCIYGVPGRLPLLCYRQRRVEPCAELYKKWKWESICGVFYDV